MKRKGAFWIALGIALGLVAFAAGLLLARAYLPEWRQESPRPKAFYLERFAAVARQAGFAPSERPKLALLEVVTDPARSLWRTLSSKAIRVQQRQSAPSGPAGNPRSLHMDFSLAGDLRRLTVYSGEILILFGPAGPPPPDETAPLLPLFLRAGESLRPESPGRFTVEGSAPAAELRVTGRGDDLQIVRQTVPEPSGFSWRNLRVTIYFVFPVGLLVFFVLGVRRRLTLRNGLWLGVVSFAAVFVAERLLPVEPPLQGALRLGQSLLFPLGAFLLWSASESLLRVADPFFTTSLDALRFGRLGPRGGRSLLVGWAVGAAYAGLELALNAWSEVAFGGRTADSVVIPGLSIDNPVTRAIWEAAGILLIVALARRFSGRFWPWTLALAVPLVALTFSPLSATSPTLGSTANLALLGILVAVLIHFGAAALLTAVMVSTCLVHAAFAAFHPEWMAGSLTALGLLLAGILAVGFVALGGSPERENARLAPPAFVRRLAEDRSLELELELLRRLQLGLLQRPDELPQLEGWQLAARSIVAHEAGGDFFDATVDDEGHLWVAVGDVSGHGYSCALGQAMALASLAALVGARVTPSEVLARIDRVLRRAAISRQFTTLALLKLDPASGTGLLANGGHPPPWLVQPGDLVREVAGPGQPPLGQGPPRRYQDLPVELPPGSSLVFSTDGLNEAIGANGEAYGTARSVLAGTVHLPADEILVRVLADWQATLDKGRLDDDTTLFILKRRRHRETRG